MKNWVRLSACMALLVVLTVSCSKKDDSTSNSTTSSTSSTSSNNSNTGYGYLSVYQSSANVYTNYDMKVVCGKDPAFSNKFAYTGTDNKDTSIHVSFVFGSSKAPGEGAYALVSNVNSVDSTNAYIRFPGGFVASGMLIVQDKKIDFSGVSLKSGSTTLSMTGYIRCPDAASSSTHASTSSTATTSSSSSTSSTSSTSATSVAMNSALWKSTTYSDMDVNCGTSGGLYTMYAQKGNLLINIFAAFTGPGTYTLTSNSSLGPNQARLGVTENNNTGWVATQGVIQVDMSNNKVTVSIDHVELHISNGSEVQTLTAELTCK